MYQREEQFDPIEIDREEYVNIVFDLGLLHCHGYDSIIAAVEIGDKFVISPKNDTNDIIARHYSSELAHITTVLASKANEDEGYIFTKKAVNDTNNGLVYKMEWEICRSIGFHIKIDNFITFIGKTLHLTGTPIVLSSVFWDLSKDICMNRELLSMDPFTILTGCLLLNKMRKLRAIKSNKQRVFFEIMSQMAHEYELDLNDVLQAYINIKRIKD